MLEDQLRKGTGEQSSKDEGAERCNSELYIHGDEQSRVVRAKWGWLPSLQSEIELDRGE